MSKLYIILNKIIKLNHNIGKKLTVIVEFEFLEKAVKLFSRASGCEQAAGELFGVVAAK